MMIYKSFKKVFFVLLIFFVSPLFELKGQSRISVTPNRITRLGIFGATNSDSGAFFFKLTGIACTDDGKLFLADQQLNTIRVFQIETGKELYRFGKKGSGQGEFYSGTLIRLHRGGVLSVIDNALRRCTLFNLKGKIISIFSLKHYADDLDFLNDSSVIVTSFQFASRYYPLRIMSVPQGTIIERFGRVIEPRRGIISEIEKKFSQNADFYSAAGWISRILVLPNKNYVLYSQRHPYTLVKFDLSTKQGATVSAPIDLDTEDQITIENIENYIRIGLEKRSGQVLTPSIQGNRLLVPIMSADVQDNYLDYYDMSMVLKERLRIPPLPKGAIPIWSAFRGSKELLILVRDEVGLNWVERFELNIKK